MMVSNRIGKILKDISWSKAFPELYFCRPCLDNQAKMILSNRISFAQVSLSSLNVRRQYDN